MKHLLKTVILLLLITSCKNEASGDYPIDKSVWDITDYENVAQEILYGTPDGEKFPTMADNPEVFSKLVDKNAVAQVLDDESLGLNYRQEYSEKLFSVWRNLIEAYSIKDRQDKFIYPLEVVKLRDWGYFIQIKYFKLGNDAIRKDAVDPQDSNVQRVIGENKQTIIDNFESGISFLTEEDALTSEALEEYSVVLKSNYTTLIETFTGANYGEMEETIDDILKKIKSDSIKKSLSEIKTLIESKKNTETSDTVDEAM